MTMETENGLTRIGDIANEKTKPSREQMKRKATDDYMKYADAVSRCRLILDMVGKQNNDSVMNAFYLNFPYQFRYIVERSMSENDVIGEYSLVELSNEDACNMISKAIDKWQALADKAAAEMQQFDGES